MLGIYPDAKFRKLALGEAITEVAKLPGVMVMNLAQVFTSVETAKERVGGPGETLSATSAAVKGGLWDILAMAGGLSIVLGVINLIPVPPLDGGQMLIAFVEILRGNRRVSYSLQSTLHTVGFFLVLLLMLAPFVVDASRRADSNAKKDSIVPMKESTPLPTN